VVFKLVDLIKFVFDFHGESTIFKNAIITESRKM